MHAAVCVAPRATRQKSSYSQYYRRGEHLLHYAEDILIIYNYKTYFPQAGLSCLGVFFVFKILHCPQFTSFRNHQPGEIRAHFKFKKM